jgi:hypothetical protein
MTFCVLGVACVSLVVRGGGRRQREEGNGVSGFTPGGCRQGSSARVSREGVGGGGRIQHRPPDESKEEEEEEGLCGWTPEAP